MINVYLYLYWVKLKVFYQRNRNAVKNKINTQLKRACGCSYTIKPGQAKTICQTCKGWQKHSGWQ